MASQFPCCSSRGALCLARLCSTGSTDVPLGGGPPPARRSSTSFPTAFRRPDFAVVAHVVLSVPALGYWAPTLALLTAYVGTLGQPWPANAVRRGDAKHGALSRAGAGRIRRGGRPITSASAAPLATRARVTDLILLSSLLQSVRSPRGTFRRIARRRIGGWPCRLISARQSGFGATSHSPSVLGGRGFWRSPRAYRPRTLRPGGCLPQLLVMGPLANASSSRGGRDGDRVALVAAPPSASLPCHATRDDRRMTGRVRRDRRARGHAAL